MLSQENEQLSQPMSCPRKLGHEVSKSQSLLFKDDSAFGSITLSRSLLAIYLVSFLCASSPHHNSLVDIHFSLDIIKNIWV